ncbi:MAG: hypothetical protein LBS06_07690, partial [Treponema sp.]|nr:hypothetical protein [Treponema sp.]
APKLWQAPALRITVDTAEDYKRVLLLWETLAASPDPEDRFRGEAIIAAGREIFPGGNDGSISPAGAAVESAAGAAGREPR